MSLSEAMFKAEAAVDALVAVDAQLMSSDQAAGVVRFAAELEARLGAWRLKCGKRAVEGNVHMVTGARDGASWFASASGVSAGAAKEALATAERLNELPAVDEAFRSGRVSQEQASVIARSVSDDASAQALVAAVENGVPMVELKRQCRRVAASREGEATRWLAMRRRRRFSTWVDGDGMVSGSFCLMPDDGAVLLSRLKPFVAPAYRAARAVGEPATQERCAADAFVALMKTSGQETKTRRVDVVVSVDYEALVRGHLEGGETCEIDGVGPVPVAVARSMAQDCYLSVLVRKGARPVAERSTTQEIPTGHRLAVLQRDRCCQVPGCGSMFDLEVDHIVPRAHDRNHSIDNLMALCAPHHRQKTFRGFRMVGAGDNRRWLAPDDPLKEAG